VLAVALLANRLHRLGDETRRARVLVLGWLFFTLGPLALFLIVPTAQLPAMCSSIGIVVVWSVAAYALAQPSVDVAPSPLAAQARVTPRQRVPAWTERS
jgi:hypothetical protein